MALSPNYNWSEPDNSSLVKDGAQAIRTLGDAIDTSVWNVGFGQAGKNKIINGDFTINQRNFTSNTANVAYNFDRWQQQNGGGGTNTLTPQTFTPGTAPVAGYEGSTFLQAVTASQSLTGDYALITQRIENVRTFAGQTVTFSFWAKATSGTPKVGLEFSQNFGSGGSPSSDVNTAIGAVTLSTSWARYSITATVPSISGKTIGTTANTSMLMANLWISGGATFNTRASSIGIQNNTFQFWGVQVEYGSKATPFQTASGGSIQGEIAMCQRYYWRTTASDVYTFFNFGVATSTVRTDHYFQFPVRMRTKPTAIESANLYVSDSAGGNSTAGALIFNQGNSDGYGTYQASSSGLTQFRPMFLESNNTTAAYVAFSAEL
jgi:hypothetical protein